MLLTVKNGVFLLYSLKFPNVLCPKAQSYLRFTRNVASSFCVHEALRCYFEVCSSPGAGQVPGAAFDEAQRRETRDD